MANEKINVAQFITCNSAHNRFRVLIERSGFKALKNGIPSLEEAIAWRDEQMKNAPEKNAVNKNRPKKIK